MVGVEVPGDAEVHVGDVVRCSGIISRLGDCVA